MSKICPKCNKEWPDEFMACPLDGATLVSKPTQSGFSLNLGDANAINGGVNLSDNHSINNTSTSSVDSHNVITNNITQIEREKSPEEIKQEKELSFREACKDVCKNGLMTSEDKRKLEDLQYRLGIDTNTANRIISEVSRLSEKKSATLSPVHQITFNNIKTAILANRLDIVNRLFAQMKAMVQKYSAEEIQYTYYMLKAVLHPEDCISEYQDHREDKYWQSFWSSIAYRRLGKIEESEILVADVGDKWTDTIPQENVFILASVNALLDDDFDSAKSLFDNITGEYSQYLTNLANCLFTILYGDTLSNDDLKQMQKDSVFYSDNLFTKFKVKTNTVTKLLDEKQNQQEIEEKKEDVVVVSHKEETIQVAEITNKKEEPKIIEKKTLNNTDKEICVKDSQDSSIFTNPSLLFKLKSKSAIEQQKVYEDLIEKSSMGNSIAGSYLSYFYIHGIIVTQNLDIAESRIMAGNYQKDPILMRLLVELYTKKGIPALANIWKQKLNNLKK